LGKWFNILKLECIVKDLKILTLLYHFLRCQFPAAISPYEKIRR
jgi:hypothetical protein